MPSAMREELRDIEGRSRRHGWWNPAITFRDWEIGQWFASLRTAQGQFRNLHAASRAWRSRRDSDITLTAVNLEQQAGPVGGAAFHGPCSVRYRQEHDPAGYPGDGSECAEIVLFLVTDHGKWITGQALNVDGGTV
jgi:hypothetical protein